MKLQLDGNKMIHHLDRVSKFMKGDTFAPIQLDIGIAKWCNIGCVFCTADAFKKQKLAFTGEPLIQFMRDAGESGVKSITIAGDGEPALNPSMYDAVQAGKKAGVDISLCSNGILLDESRMPELLSALTYLKFTFSATTAESYKRIHRSDKFDEAVKKIRAAVRAKRENGLAVTLGLQMVLVPEAEDQIVPLARFGAEVGVDYVQIKQFSYVESPTGSRGMRDYDVTEFTKFYPLLREAEKFARPDYKVFVKWNDIELQGRRNYDQCYGTPFLHHVMSDGKVYPCVIYFGKEEFCLGDLNKTSYKEIIASDHYRTIIQRITKEVDVHTQCGKHCRQNGINTFLWGIKNPPDHVNFI